VTPAATDPGVRLREFVLAERRRRLRSSAARLLVVSSGDEAAAVAGADASFDAAWVALATVEGVDVSALGRALARVLRPGSRVECVLPGAWALPAVLERALRGTGESPREWRARFDEGAARPVTPSEWRRAFGPAFCWARGRALGVVLPGPWSGAWAAHRPALFGLLAAADDVVGTWPMLRTLGDQILLQGARR
jgi:hypothetical protein